MSKNLDVAGYIFLCSDATEQECLERSLFGGKEKYPSQVKGVTKGSRLYLYNFQSKKLHGAFEATTDLGEKLVPAAWGGEYAWQIKVKRIENWEPLLRTEIPREILKFNAFQKPSARLSTETVQALDELFKTQKREVVYRDDFKFRTQDGHWVRSKVEQEIDDWLYSHQLSHGYEVPIGSYRCDFKVSVGNKDVYIEFWGLETKAYTENKEEKIKLYTDKGYNLLSLDAKNAKNFGEVLAKYFLKH